MQDHDDENAPLISPTEDVALAPSELGDPPETIREKIPNDVLEKYEVYSF